MILITPIESLPATRSLTFQRMKSIGINTYWDLLNYFPYRYENYSLISGINNLQDGEIVTVKGTLQETKNIYTRTGLKIQKGVLAHANGKIELTWYNQPYILRILKNGSLISVAGLVKGDMYRKAIEVKEFEVLKTPEQKTIHTGRLVPVYSEKNGLSARLIREKISLVLNQLSNGRDQDGIPDFLPAEIIQFNNLMSESEAYRTIHFPSGYKSARIAAKRLGFDELFTIQLAAQITREEWRKENVTHAFNVGNGRDRSLQKFISSLPFELTLAQKRVVEEIIKDLKKPIPMNRFLEGDVGSGKTVVAAIACYLAYLNGFQSLFMAPTEILAQQHYQTIKKLFGGNGFKPFPKVGLQTGSKKIEDKHFDIIIGTHALIQKKLDFKKAGLVIVDEQHRFGVAQRSQLKEKGMNPHLLTMTATPIPRTIALTLYGELDLSVIDEMPKGRLPIKTFLVPQEKRQAGYKWIAEQVKKSVQVFVICPLIEESNVETMQSMKAAKKEYERLKTVIFPQFKLGLLHGKMKSREKEEMMKQFKENKINILVATSVVEVGIDIPNATIMMIEGADRFGMAQLHQLRGRVGRGSEQSYCFLYTESMDERTQMRLQLFAKTQSGIQVAEYDFKLRGPGEIFGTRQHGYMNLKIASLSDYDLIDKSKKAVHYFREKYRVDEYPEIKSRLEEYRVKQVSRD